MLDFLVGINKYISKNNRIINDGNKIIRLFNIADKITASRGINISISRINWLPKTSNSRVAMIKTSSAIVYTVDISRCISQFRFFLVS